MVSEGFAQYGALQAVRAVLGGPAELAVLRHGSATFPNDSIDGYLRLATLGRDAALDTHPTGQEQILLLHRLATSKGMAILYMLGQLIGRENLNDALRRFVSAHVGDDVTLNEIEQAINASTHQDLTWFFDQWFRQTGAPHLTIACTSERRGTWIRISQTDQPYRLYLPIALRSGDVRRTLSVNIQAKKESLSRGPVISGPTQLVADPDGQLLHWPIRPAPCGTN